MKNKELSCSDRVIQLLKKESGLQRFEIIERLGYNRKTRSTPVNAMQRLAISGEIVQRGGLWYAK